MSEEQLKAFLAKAKGDTSLQEKLKAAANPDAVLAIAKEAGFSISADELKSEISEEELEGVAGGEACWNDSNNQSSLVPNYWCGGIDGPKLN